MVLLDSESNGVFWIFQLSLNQGVAIEIYCFNHTPAAPHDKYATLAEYIIAIV